MHHYRWRKHGDPLVTAPLGRAPQPKKPCSIDGCPTASRKRGYCIRHYARWKLHGDAEHFVLPRRGHHQQWTREQWVAAFTARTVRTEAGCLEWIGNLNENGYGRYTFEGEQWFTHRLAYSLFVGPIPDRLLVCHHCDNPPCCEPSHLFVGDNPANLADMRAKGRGHVPTPARGAAHPRTQLVDDDVRAIRMAHAGGETQSAIARRLGISRGIVSAICLHKTWKHVT